MKANEFVKKFGWDYTVELLNDNAWSLKQCMAVSLLDDSADDLKHLAESYDYIKSLGGISFVKDNLPLGYFGDGNYKELIQECLEDVESCL